jgi:hypothetical protein
MRGLPEDIPEKISLGISMSPMPNSFHIRKRRSKTEVQRLEVIYGTLEDGKTHELDSLVF